MLDERYAIPHSKSIVIHGGTRDDYMRGQSWVADHPECVVQAFFTPRKIVADKSHANRVFFYGPRHENDPQVIVVVELKQAKGVSHRVVTAFEVRSMEVIRRESLEPVLWELSEGED